jgi:hypothetical protein
VVANFRERLAVSKEEAQNFDGERFNLRKLNELAVMKQYQIEITNKFGELENLSDEDEIYRNLNIKDNFNTSAK